METMHINQFVVLLMALLMLGKNAVCQQALNFNNASEIWQEQSCIFPDKSAYKTEASDIMPKLEKCRLLDNRTLSADPDDFAKTSLCQSFYQMTITMCKNKKWQYFIQRCLNPDILQQKKPFAEKGVCTYIFESKQAAKYFDFFQTIYQCQRNCGVNNGLDNMRNVCELYAFLIYQFEYEKTCNETETQTQPGTGNSKFVEQSDQGKNDQASGTQKSPTTLSASSETESTSTTPQFTGLVSANKTLEGLDFVNTNKAFNTAGNNTSPTSTGNETRHSDDTSATKGYDLKTTGLNNDGSKAPEPSMEKFEPPASLLISKITSTTTKEGETTGTTPTQEEEESTAIANQSTSLGKGGDVGYDIDSQEGSRSDGGQPNEDLSSSEDDTTDVDKGNTLDNKFGTGKKQSQDTLAKNNKQAVDVYDDTESSPGSGHFLAYFLTAVVICISGYVIYHNKQKILAFIIEGRNSGRGGRQRSKDVKYTQLKSSVEEVMPSLEQTATGKNFVY